MIWSKEKEQYLIDNFKNLTTGELAKSLSTNVNSIYKRSNKLGLKRMVSRKWNKEEVKILIDNYDSLSNKQISLMLNRTVGSIEIKAKSLKLKKSIETITKIRIKDVDKINFIKNNYGKMTAKEIANHFGDSVGNIDAMLSRYKLRQSKPKSKAKSNSPWSLIDKQFLLNNYKTMQYKIIAISLGRPLASINKKAEHMGLVKEIKNDNWSKEEIEYLKLNFEYVPLIIAKSFLTKRNISSIRVKACELGLNRDIPSTYIEREVESILKIIDIPYNTQVKGNGYIADFMIYNNKIIEVQGDYWHCNPKVYDNPINEVQRLNIKNDKRKEKIYTQLGYKVLYIWEYDLNNDYDNCIKRIEAFAVLGRNA